MKRLFAGVLLMLLGAATQAQDGLHQYAAGSLRAALTDVAQAFTERYGIPVETTFAPSGLLDVLLDPDIRLGTSTPNADPSGDYAWELFERAEALRPGSYEALDAKALQPVAKWPDENRPKQSDDCFGRKRAVYLARGVFDIEYLVSAAKSRATMSLTVHRSAVAGTTCLRA